MRILKSRTCSEDPESRLFLVVNKVDNIQKFMMDVYEFYNLGIGDPVPIRQHPDRDWRYADEIVAENSGRKRSGGR